MNAELFEDEYEEDNSPIDTTEIKSKLLYFSIPEHAEFDRLSKTGMKKEFPDNFQEQNQSDFLLYLLRKHYGENNS